MNVRWNTRDRRQFIWPAAAVVIGALAGANTFYQPHITLEVGIAVWVVDMAVVLILSAHPITARIGVLVAGLCLAVPCFLRESALSRFLLMCFMGFPLAFAVVPLFSSPTAGFRERLHLVFSWLGAREVKRRERSFDVAALLYLIVATLILIGGISSVKAIDATGFGLLARWFAGGITMLAFAGMATASHNLLTALVGIRAPALMQSPHLATSISEFWSKRWNPAASLLLFRAFFFAPVSRRGATLALFAAFLASAVAHVLLPYMAMGRWGISLMCGAFFLVQPAFILAERRLNVRRWRPAAARVWTLGVLALTSPLFVEPVIQLIEPSWGAVDDVLFPAIAVLGFVMVVNVVVSLGSLAGCPALAPPDKSLQPTAAAPGS